MVASVGIGIVTPEELERSGSKRVEHLDRRIAEMRQLLAAMAEETDSAALKALREAFPDTSLALRVAALARRR